MPALRNVLFCVVLALQLPRREDRHLLVAADRNGVTPKVRDGSSGHTDAPRGMQRHPLPAVHWLRIALAQVLQSGIASHPALSTQRRGQEIFGARQRTFCA